MHAFWLERDSRQAGYLVMWRYLSRSMAVFKSTLSRCTSLVMDA